MKAVNLVFEDYLDHYRLTYEDFVAKEFCHQRGITCEAYRIGDTGMVRIWIDSPDGNDFLREKEYPEDKAAYAVYESYRAIAAKIYKRETNGSSSN